MTALPEPRNDRDDDLERAIKAEIDAMNGAADRETAQAHWQKAVKLIGQRSPTKVRQMERERRIA